MYTEAHLLKVIEKLSDLVNDPVKALELKTKLSRSTIKRFIRREGIKFNNQDLLFEACLDIIEEKQIKRLALIEKSKRILELEQQFTVDSDKDPSV